MPAFTAPDGTELASHVMGDGEPLLCLPGGPMRASAYLGTLTLVTARARALGVDFTEKHRREAAALRKDEPWFADANKSYERIRAGSAVDADWDSVAPFFYGRWDKAARAHAATDVEQSNEEAADLYASPDAFDPVGARAVVTGWEARVLVLVGELDSGPLPRVADEIAELFREAESAVLPGAGHFPWLDDPRRFTETVTAFLDQDH
jgi:pimeloyl-ACP methyl ester carboxylesterase